MVVLFWLVYLREFHLAHNGIWTEDLWISSPAVKHYAAVTSVFHFWQFQVFNSGAEGLVVVLFWLDLWEILFLTTLEFELGIYGSAILHSSTEPQWILVFTSENLRYLTLVQRDWWWWCSDWTYVRFLFAHYGIWTGDICMSSPVFYPCSSVTSGFHLWQFQLFNSGAEGLVVLLFWIDCWEILLLPQWDMTWGPLELGPAPLTISGI